MADMSNQSATPVSDVMLARYVAGDLSGEQLARVERAIDATPGLAERLARMKEDRDSFLRSTPPDQFAHNVVTRLTVEKPPERAKWNVWWLMPPVSVAAALLFGVVYQQSLGPQRLTPAAVQTDDAYALPEAPRAGLAQNEAAPQPEPEVVAPAEEGSLDAAKADSGARDESRRDAKDALSRSARNEARPGRKEPGLADRDGTGGGGMGGVPSLGMGAAPAKGYAQPPADDAERAKAEAKPMLEKPKAAQTDAPPVWAAPPPPAPSSTPRSAASAPAAPAPATPPAATATGPASTAPASKKSAAAREEPTNADKARGRAADEENLAQVEKEAGPAGLSVAITREQGGRARPVVANEAIPVNAQLKVTASGGKHVTVIGVRRDGLPHVYAHGESAGGAPVTLAVKLRPTSARVPEVLFVVVGDAALSLAREPLGGAKDASELPLRLPVTDVQRRYAIAVSAAAE